MHWEKWLAGSIALGCAAAAALAAGSTHMARANDGSVGGVGSNLIPVVTDDVSMVSEDVEITFVDRQWHVDAAYEFRNNASAPVDVQMGFPEYRCDPERTLCNDDYHFDRMRTDVRGEPVEMRTGAIDPAHAWAGFLGQVWLFDVAFGPNETVEVRHRYQVPTAAVSDGTYIHDYVTGTGSLWAGPIGTARFRVRLPVDTSAMNEWTNLDPRLAQVELNDVEAYGRPMKEVVFEARDWTPSRAATFSFRRGIDVRNAWRKEEGDARPYRAWETLAGAAERSGLPPTESCPDFVKIWELASYTESWESRAKWSDGAAVDSADNSARMCINQLFAAYGRRFVDDSLNRYFYGPDGWVPGTWPYGVLEPNPDFDVDLMTDMDWRAVDLFRQMGAEAELAKAEAASRARRSPSGRHTRPGTY